MEQHSLIKMKLVLHFNEGNLLSLETKLRRKICEV